MAKTTSISCDQCGHSWKPSPWPGEVFGTVHMEVYIHIAETAMNPGERNGDFCSAECATKWLTTQLKQAGATTKKRE